MRIKNSHDEPTLDGQALLAALVEGACSEADVQYALTKLVVDPLARVHSFRGDLLRALMEVPNAFWARHRALYEEYRQAVRRAALARRDMSAEARLEFWSPLEMGDEG